MKPDSLHQPANREKASDAAHNKGKHNVRKKVAFTLPLAMVNRVSNGISPQLMAMDIVEKT